jgi:hypothetical protein
MVKKKLPYREGTWFAVPLRNSGYAVGVVARMNSEGGIFGYFFGPKQDSVPCPDDVDRLRADQATWQAHFGGLGLLNGEWPIILNSLNWNRESWPLPPFINVDRVSGNAFKVKMSDDLTPLTQEPCDPSLAEQYPEDGVFGYGAVEIRLTKLLGV